ncbi:MAG: glutamine synthetase family protein [Proteobacteria bacterium]|nr:glutamine synthetase family protein [Pseudomonadota bacterium]
MRGRSGGRIDLEELGRRAREGEIETVITAFPDLYGRLVGKRIQPEFFLDEVAGQGMHCCDYLLACDMEMDPTPGYAFTNWESGYGDFRALPDFDTLRLADWLPRTALVLCDCLNENDDEPVAVAPRAILRRQIERLAERGLDAHMGSELEFFLFAETYASARAKHYHGLDTHQAYIEDYHVLSGTFAEPVVGAIRRHVNASGIPVEFSKGEWGPGQHEINLRYARALEMADRHVVYKQAAKEIAAAAGRALTFMAKWDTDCAGNSLHVHVSLTDADGESAFAGGSDDAVLPGTNVRASSAFHHALGGLLAHARELALLFAPTPNSYKRYQSGTFAPTRVAWSIDNRTAGFRVVGHGPSLRIECRIPGADANPYLVYAGLLAAVRDGLERRLDPGPPHTGDAYADPDLPSVPHNLGEAIAAFDASAFVREAFGDAVVEHLVHFARTELAHAERVVTDVERVRFFERI